MWTHTDTSTSTDKLLYTQWVYWFFSIGGLRVKIISIQKPDKPKFQKLVFWISPRPKACFLTLESKNQGFENGLIQKSRFWNKPKIQKSRVWTWAYPKIKLLKNVSDMCVCHGKYFMFNTHKHFYLTHTYKKGKSPPKSLPNKRVTPLTKPDLDPFIAEDRQWNQVVLVRSSPSSISSLKKRIYKIIKCKIQF